MCACKRPKMFHLLLLNLLLYILSHPALLHTVISSTVLITHTASGAFFIQHATASLPHISLFLFLSLPPSFLLIFTATHPPAAPSLALTFLFFSHTRASPLRLPFFPLAVSFLIFAPSLITVSSLSFLSLITLSCRVAPSTSN